MRAGSAASITIARSSCRTGPFPKDLPQGGTGLWRLDASVAGSGVTGDLLAHCIDTAMWLNGGIDQVTAMTETFVKERMHNLTGKVEPVRHRRREPLPRALRQRLAREFRGDPLRARPQGALHVRDQRRARLDLLGSARPASAAVFRSPRRGDRARLAVAAHHRQRSSLHEALVGAGPADRLRAHLRSPGRRLPRRPRHRQAGGADFPGRTRHRPGDRRRAALGAERRSGSGPERDDRALVAGRRRQTQDDDGNGEIGSADGERKRGCAVSLGRHQGLWQGARP